jgi:hypothetical protein
MARIGEGFIIEALHNRSFKGGDRKVEFGTASFSGTGTTVEVSTNLTTVEVAMALPKTVTYNANDQLSSDGVVTSGAVTFARNASGTSGLEFYYILIGTTEATVS